MGRTTKGRAMSHLVNESLLDAAYEALEGEVDQDKVNEISKAIKEHDLEKLAWLLKQNWES